MVEARVLDLVYEADGVISLRLSPLDGKLIEQASPGSHVDLVLPNGLERQYSVIDASSDGSWLRVAVLKDPASRGGSEYIHLFLRPGQTLGLKGPRNHFRLTDAQEYLFLAGGIGITPILPMVEAVNAEQRTWQLHYGGKRLSTMAFAERVRALGANAVLWPEDSAGPIALEQIIPAARAGLQLYACGPAGMLTAVEAVAAAKGYPVEAIHFERFKPTVREPVENFAFNVFAARSRINLEVPANQSVLDALGEAGIAVASSCRNGVCGTCEVGVLDGEPDHRDDVLSSSEQQAGDRMMVCVSRARSSELTLDV